MSNSTKQIKPQKPYSGYPLFPHASGRWCKKIRGKHHYFGKWIDPDGGLQKYQDQRDYLHSGRTPRVTGEGLTIAELCNQFLNSKKRLLDNGEITDLSFRDYYATCTRIVDEFGRNRLAEDLAANDFELFRSSLAKTRGPVALGYEIGRTKMVYKYGFDQSLITTPIRYGQSFSKPSRKVLRIARNQAGPIMFEADELRLILESAKPVMRAMVLLGINCGLGNSDVVNLPQSAIDFKDDWLDYPRPKTGIDGRCPLWSETVTALREAIERRPDPKNEADVALCFLTQQGNRWVRTSNHTNPGERASLDAVAQQFRKLLKKLDINGRRNFYAFRHSFQTIAEESRDLSAVKHVMGHADDSMSARYRERISDKRLKAVVDTVRGWLWPDAVESE